MLFGLPHCTLEYLETDFSGVISTTSNSLIRQGGLGRQSHSETSSQMASQPEGDDFAASIGSAIF